MDAHRAAGSAQILIVDDDPTQRELFQRALLGPGYSVATAASATEALALLVMAPFDLVCTDLDLASQEDWTLLAALRQQAPTLPIGVVTDWSVSGLASELAPLGVVFVLTKPVPLRRWREQVAAALGHGPLPAPAAPPDLGLGHA